MFQDTASSIAPIATGSGRQLRRASTRAASGIATKRSRSMLPPSSDGTRYAPTMATRYTAKKNRSTRAPASQSKSPR